MKAIQTSEQIRGRAVLHLLSCVLSCAYHCIHGTLHENKAHSNLSTYYNTEILMYAGEPGCKCMMMQILLSFRCSFSQVAEAVFFTYNCKTLKLLSHQWSPNATASTAIWMNRCWNINFCSIALLHGRALTETNNKKVSLVDICFKLCCRQKWFNATAK